MKNLHDLKFEADKKQTFYEYSLDPTGKNKEREDAKKAAIRVCDAYDSDIRLNKEWGDNAQISEEPGYLERQAK